MGKLALLIGVSEYQPGLNPLPGAVKDVDAMRRVLIHPEIGNFAEVDITVLKNPQGQEMQYAIENLFADRQKEDLLLFYFSGHGIKDEYGKLYLSTSTTRKQNNRLFKASAVAASVLHENMNESRSQRQVIILDCCFSGAIAKGLTVKDDGSVNLQEQLGGKGRAILTSSTSTQYSFEQEGSDLSIYTRYLVEGMEKGAADRDGDGWISIDELHEYASSKVKEAAPAMTPKFYPIEEGHKILLAKSPKDDPKVKYRKEVESRAKEGQEFSVFARRILDGKRDEWGLTPQEAAAIEEEVLQPYREYEHKRDEYEQALIQAIDQQYPFSQTTQKDLKEYQQYLGLRDEDIASIEQRIITPKQAEYEHNRQEAERLQQEQERTQQQKQQAELRELPETQSSRVSQPKSPSVIQTNIQTDIQTQQFEFEYATIILKSSLDRGKTYEINRHRGQAEFFTENLGNNALLEMVAIPGGQFLMGSPEYEPERLNSESPQHTVTIQPFHMSKFPVKQAQWKAVAGLAKVNIDLDPDPSFFKGANRSVESVSWDDAIEFCNRLSHKTGKPYRLPSEAEWEYACRAGTTTPFHFGETITTDLANYNGNSIYASEPKGEYRQQTTEVGKFPPNAFGLYDMHGNIWEWCQDAWHYSYKKAPADGTAWMSENDNDNRLLRGGSWTYEPRDCRSANRSRFARVFKNHYVGFRVVVARLRTY
ncbi:sulfatase-modifying factor protein [Brasilonema octagenarum UFV-E1]|uniref:Sulfatase-modifying factor protein n=1 Tax=Brasilonema sennae CENA114 TaxID=415709 RepID=A0A856MCR6_9CYAN|nr:SUMF1/EgtB/PvdO family nonheme iron enzyme [Brasilonema sennae]QDL08973.1 sulfatase-modifying factor protein [Brasilonema sennae CENA114]QDL15328.1 sulfatase-modifying factor protein [Brasilonema octagenarum UFV-E1]